MLLNPVTATISADNATTMTLNSSSCRSGGINFLLQLEFTATSYPAFAYSAPPDYPAFYASTIVDTATLSAQITLRDSGGTGLLRLNITASFNIRLSGSPSPHAYHETTASAFDMVELPGATAAEIVTSDYPSVIEGDPGGGTGNYGTVGGSNYAVPGILGMYSPTVHFYVPAGAVATLDSISYICPSLTKNVHRYSTMTAMRPTITLLNVTPSADTVDAENPEFEYGDSDGTVEQWVWAWGDGSITTTAVNTASHEYEESGDYTVSLYVRDDDGGESDDLTQEVSITAEAKRIGTFLHPGGPLFSAIRSPDTSGAVQIYRFPENAASRESLALQATLSEPSLWQDDTGAIFLSGVSGSDVSIYKSLDNGLTFSVV